MRTETKERQTDRFSIEDEAGDRYTVSERTTYTQDFPDDGGAPGKPVPGAVRYQCADLAVVPLDSGEYELQTDPPRRCKRVD